MQNYDTFWIFKVVENESNLIWSDRTGIGHSKNNIFCYCLFTCFKINNKKGQNFAMSKITINVFFETFWTPCKKPHLSCCSRTKFTFFGPPHINSNNNNNNKNDDNFNNYNSKNNNSNINNKVISETAISYVLVMKKPRKQASRSRALWQGAYFIFSNIKCLLSNIKVG